MMRMWNKMVPGAIAAFAVALMAAGPAPAVWNVDEPHTGIGFTAKHFFTPVNGQFDDYDIELTYDRENPANSQVRARIAVGSVNTGNEGRDEHLMSDDFFEAETYPYITFVSELVEQVAPDRLLVRGPLKIKGQTRDVELPVRILGVQDIPEEMQEMLGGITELASFSTTLTVDRGDYNVGVGSWAAALVVGSDIDIDIAVEANR
jgi:polyisoprenoid-binding protein YceI